MNLEHVIVVLGLVALIAVSLAFVVWLEQPQEGWRMYLVPNQTCDVELCRTDALRETCFGLRATDCDIMLEKCEDTEYLKQWEIECHVIL